MKTRSVVVDVGVGLGDRRDCPRIWRLDDVRLIRFLERVRLISITIRRGGRVIEFPVIFPDKQGIRGRQGGGQGDEGGRRGPLMHQRKRRLVPGLDRKPAPTLFHRFPLAQSQVPDGNAAENSKFRHVVTHGDRPWIADSGLRFPALCL
jgi:hypothetical protein